MGGVQNHHLILNKSTWSVDQSESLNTMGNQWNDLFIIDRLFQIVQTNAVLWLVQIGGTGVNYTWSDFWVLLAVKLVFVGGYNVV